MRFPLLSLVLLAACNPVETTVLTNDGVICIDETAGEVVVDMQTCLSSSCDTLISSECAVTLDGDTLTVTSTATIDSQGTTCTDDCGFVVVRCTLPDGDLSATTVRHGAESASYASLIGACDAF